MVDPPSVLRVGIGKAGDIKSAIILDFFWDEGKYNFLKMWCCNSVVDLLLEKEII